MKITKIAHSCLLVEEQGARILMDPGGTFFSFPEVENIDVILISHEHVDHYDPKSIQKTLGKSPSAKIYTNKGVGEQLSKANIPYSLLEEGSSTMEKGILIEAFGSLHAVISPGMPQVYNTGYLIAEKLFHPGDALTVPPKKVQVLALPITAPWMKLSEGIEYAQKIKPEVCFPIHDAILKEPLGSRVAQMPKSTLEQAGIKYNFIEPGKIIEI